MNVPVDLPLGEELNWKPVPRPTSVSLHGSHILVRPVNAESDAVPLFSISHPPDGDPAIWTYLFDGPYESPGHLRQTLAWAETSEDPLYFTLVRLADERPLGLASYLRITPEFGVIEIGHIWFGVPLQAHDAATEAIYLLIRHAFDDLGYRRARVEVQRAQRGLAACRRALRVRLRGRLPQAHGGQGPQPRHRVVCDHRRCVAGDPTRVRGMARAGEHGRRGPSETVARGAPQRSSALTRRTPTSSAACVRSCP